MSKSSTASVSKNLALLPAKSAWSRGLLCQQWCQVLTLNPQHFLLLLRFILIVLALLVKLVLLKVISLLLGSAVTFGSIYDALSQISTSPTSAPIIKLSEGVKLSRTVPATAPTSGHVNGKPSISSRPQPASAPSSTTLLMSIPSTSSWLCHPPPLQELVIVKGIETRMGYG